MNAALSALADALINDQNVSDETRAAAKVLLETAQAEQADRKREAEIISYM